MTNTEKMIKKIAVLSLLLGSTIRLDAQVADSTSGPNVMREDARFMILPGVPEAENKVPVDFSFGLFGNESYGVKYLDFSTMINKAEGDVSGVQFSGIMNRVRGDVSGVEFSGLINTVNGTLSGFQTGGIVNSVQKVEMGMQVAGVTNVIKENSNAIQVAGIVNFAEDTLEGAQVSGLCNMNQTYMNGVQISGFNNVSNGHINGAQIAGILNYAKTINGGQIGLINVSDSINGVPVGFFSYSRTGYHKLELYNSEVFLINGAFHTGVRAFHNIFSFGVLPGNDPQLTWYAGYGFGSAMKMGRKANLVFNVTGQHISKGEICQKLNMLGVGFLGAEFSIANKFAIVAGPTLNAWMTKTNYNYPETIGDYIPETIFDQTSTTENLNTKMWIGWKIGVRLF